MIKGINQNFNPESIPEGYAYWAKNGYNNNKFDASINENGNKIDIDLTSLNIQFKNGVTTLGNIIILFYKDNLNNDCIATIDELTKIITVKITRTDFNFLIDHPIRARAKLNSKNQLVVAFVDGFNTDKYINLDTALLTDSLNFYNLFPLVNNASNITTNILESGSVTTGAYFITFRYIARDQSKSTWTTISNPVYVTQILSGGTYESSKGCNSGLSSNKAIQVTLNDIDTAYQKVEVAVISSINGVVSAKIIKQVFINSSILTFIYNGTESIGTVTVEELVADNIIYKSSKQITSVNDQLFLADLTSNITEDFQHIANQTVIRWRSTLDVTNKIGFYSKYRDGNRKTHIHDEVLALYIQFELIDGEFTAWYHIPGRIANVGDTNDSSLGTGGLQINGRTPKKYEIEDTCVFDTINGDGSKSGVMGFWQNENEFYPSNFADFRGQNVRHHKLPSIGYMYENVWTNITLGTKRYGIDVLDFLDIEVFNNSWDSTKIKGYRIGYAQKTLSDILVLGQGLTLFSGNGNQGLDINNLKNPGGNFDQICDDTTGGDDIYLNKTYLRFNSFDIQQDKPTILSSYLRNYIKLKANKLAGNATGGNNYHPDSSVYGLISAGAFFNADPNLTAYAINLTIPDDGTNIKTISSSVISADKVRKLSSQTYIPFDTNVAIDSINVDNRGSEDIIHAKIEGTSLSINKYGVIRTKTGGQLVDPTMAEEVYLSALKNPKNNVYLNFDNQTIVVNPQIVRVKTNQVIFNSGDGFIGIHSYVTLSGYGAINYIDYNKSLVNFHIHVGVSRHNVNQRYQTLGDYSSYYYPDAGLFTQVGGGGSGGKNYWFSPANYRRNQPFNVFKYSKDFSSVNNYEQFSVFNPLNINQNDFKFRIIRSLRANQENALDDGWRTFKPLDYFDTVRDKGEIVNLESFGTDALIIHHKRALFRTRDKAILQTNIINITLGSGDIFAIEPREEDPTPTGTGGTQHKYSCLLTELGYWFADEETKDIYVYDGNELKNIWKGFARFFQDNLDCEIDNPYNDQGIVLAWDNKNNRILFSQKAGENSFTVSYDVLNQEWAFAHDFVPDYMFNTRNNFYSFKGVNLYTHNIGDKGKFYGVVYPFYVDFVFNQDATVEKVLETVRWITKYRLSNTSINPRKTITSITVWNDQACTNKIAIVTNETTSLFVDQNTKQVGEIWSFNELFDNIIDLTQPFVTSLLTDTRPIGSNLSPPIWYDSLPLRGKYFIVRLEYDNIDNKEVHLRECYPTLRKSTS